MRRRKIGETNGANETTRFAYDPVGNLRLQAHPLFTGALPNLGSGCALPSAPSHTVRFCYDEANRLIAVIDGERNRTTNLVPSERHALRQEHAVPLIGQFRAWAIEQVAQLSPKSPTANAFAYVHNHWDAFVRYTERGDLKIDNNAAERALRVVAIGRKNWLFAGSERGGQAIAVLLSLIETAKANGLNPRTWLVDTLTKLPSWPNSRLRELLPLRQTA